MGCIPKIIYPPEAKRPPLALTTASLVCKLHTSANVVVKVSLRFQTDGCCEEDVTLCRELEEQSDKFLEREKIIYNLLPKSHLILECLHTFETGLRFPLHRYGDLRTYLQLNHLNIGVGKRTRWTINATESIGFVHAHGILHCDISARNFLVADDESLKLCDFAGSTIGNKEALVSEETRYRQYHDTDITTHTIQTELFATGSLIYEIMTGKRPYDEVTEDEIVKRLYRQENYPPLETVRHAAIIGRCWHRQFQSAEQVKERLEKQVNKQQKQEEKEDEEDREAEGCLAQIHQVEIYKTISARTSNIRPPTEPVSGMVSPKTVTAVAT
jgi:serine/threonine protein kinase